MSFKTILFLTLTSFSLVGLSCLNTFHALDKEGHFHDLGGDKFVGFNMNFNARLMNSKFSKLEKEIRDKKSPYLLSDYAVLLLKAGKTQESLDLLITLNRHLPSEYKITANLGTAYEIAGNLDSALHYINRGVELNPDAHEGSEWVHIKVLETKIALIENPDFLKNRTVLELTEEDFMKEEIRNQIEIQIRERFPFSPEGDDPIMASLLIDLGDCYVETATYEHANAFYQIAREYYGAKEDAVRDKIDRTIELRHQHRNIVLDDVNNEGMETRVEAIRFMSILDDNNDPPFEIDWTKINVDVDSLLALVDLEMTLEEDLKISTEPIFEEVEDGEEQQKVETADALEWGQIAGIGFSVLGLLVLSIFYFRRRSMK